MSAVRRIGAGETLPEGARPLTEEEVADILGHEIRNWRPRREMAALQFGWPTLAAAAGVSAFMLNTKFRRFLKLGAVVRVATYGASIVPVAGLCGALHSTRVSAMLNEPPHCSVCVETRSVCTQTLMAGIYPMLIVPVTGIACAYPHGLAPGRDLQANALAALRFLRKYSTFLGRLCVANAVLAAAVTYLELQALWKLQFKLASSPPQVNPTL